MIAKWQLFGVGLMSLMLLLYFYFAIIRAVALFQTGSLISISMGAALIVLPLIGVFALVRELIFGVQSAKLMKTLDSLGQIPEEEIETLPSGKPLREGARQILPKYVAEVEAAPGSWVAKMRLGIVKDAAGYRSEARSAVREAIKLAGENREGQKND